MTGASTARPGRSGPGSSSLGGLPAEVAATRRRLAALLVELEPAGSSADGRRPDPRAAPSSPGGRPTVAVVAAPGRGRHHLVAALLDRPATPPAAATPDTEPDVPLLEELDLVVPPHRPDGAWPTGEASALLVLAGAGAPLDRVELDALDEAAHRVEHVVFALVGTDAHRGWRTVLDADRALVAERVPRLADAAWFPVAPARAHRARTAPATDGVGPPAASLRRAAGIAPLQQALHRLVARRRSVLAEANALRVLADRLHGLAGPGPDPPSVPPDHSPEPDPDPDPDPGTALRRRRGALDAARADLRRGRHVRWRTGLAQARIAAVDDLAVRVRGLGAALRDDVDAADRPQLARVPARVAAGLEEIVAAVVAALGDRLRDLVAETLADLLPPAELAALPVPAPRPVAPPAGPSRARGGEDRLLVVAGASGGLGLSRLALLPLLAAPFAPAVGAALVPVSVGLGLGAAGWMVRTRRLAAERARSRAWLAEALAAARTDVERVLAEAVVTAEREVTLALDEALDRRLRALTDAAGTAEAREHRTSAARVGHGGTRARAAAGAAEAEALLARMARLLARG